jgi:predicted amino acid-binding ACT domain protein
MPISQALVARYFQLIVNRQFTEAERELERVKQKMQKTEQRIFQSFTWNVPFP